MIDKYLPNGYAIIKFDTRNSSKFESQTDAVWQPEVVKGLVHRLVERLVAVKVEIAQNVAGCHEHVCAE